MLKSTLVQLADRIRAVCRNGFFIDKDTWRYLENTLPDPTPSSVAAVLKTADDCESDSLIELLFYPDENIQVVLEPFIEKAAILKQDQAHLIDLLTAAPVDTALFFPSRKKGLYLHMPELAIHQFVIRLNLTRRLPLKVTDGIQSRLPENIAIKAKIRLRNTKLPFQDHHTDLLIDLFTKLDHREPDYWDCIDFGLNVLPEITPQTAIYEFFMAKKKGYFQSVQKAEQFGEKLHRSNMETLMMQGERAAHIHPAEGRRIMRWIDQICCALFGRSDHFQPPVRSAVELDHSDSRKALPKIIDYLS